MKFHSLLHQIFMIIQYFLLCSFSRSLQLRNDSPDNVNLLRLRGGTGSSLIESNPNYVDYNRFMPPTLGDDQQDHIRRPMNQNHQHQDQHSFYKGKKIKPLQQVVQEFFHQLYLSSPTIFYGMLSSIMIFVAWQIPMFVPLLRQHFVCSSMNILSQHNYHTLLTAAISHSSISHLLMNMYAFYIFGRSIESTLKANNIAFNLYCTLAALLSNLFSVILTPKASCLGLSGVTLSLLAFDAKLHPSKEIGFVVHFFPVRLPAQYALSGLLLWSVFGTLASLGGRYDGTAHSVHLGGLGFGILAHHLLESGRLNKLRKVMRKLRYQK